MFEVAPTQDIVRTSLTTLWSNVASFAPQLVAAIIVFLIGWLVAVLLGKVAYHIVRAIHLDSALTRVGFRRAWERSGLQLNSAHFFGELVKWLFVIVFLMAATNILGLKEVTEFLRTVVIYLPNVIIAAVILLIGILLSKVLENFVRGSVKAAGLASANFLAEATRWAIFIFSLLVALSQLGVADEIIRILIIGVVAASALAVGLAFGLGGVKHADDLIGRLRKRIGE